MGATYPEVKIRPDTAATVAEALPPTSPAEKTLAVSGRGNTQHVPTAVEPADSEATDPSVVLWDEVKAPEKSEEGDKIAPLPLPRNGATDPYLN